MSNEGLTIAQKRAVVGWWNHGTWNPTAPPLSGAGQLAAMDAGERNALADTLGIHRNTLYTAARIGFAPVKLCFTLCAMGPGYGLIVPDPPEIMLDRLEAMRLEYRTR